MNRSPRVSSTRTHEQAVLQLARKRGLLRTRDVAEHKLPTVVLTRLVYASKLERAGRGLYTLPGQGLTEHRSLAEVALRVPRCIVCLLSALRVHDIGTQAPFEVWVALPKGTVAPRLSSPPLRIVRLSGPALTEGVEYIKADGVRIAVYNVAKTIADCFKFRNKVGLDVALEALREGWRGRKVTMDQLWRYAQVNRMHNVMRPYLESEGLFLQQKRPIFRRKTMGKHAASADTRILERIRERGPGWVFTPADFADLGAHSAVAPALSRHKHAGRIRRLARGLYDIPREGSRLSSQWPTVEALVDAVKARDAVRVQPSGAYAAHLLGLTEQVPMRIAYLTDGPARKVTMGRLTITFRPTTPRNMATAGRTSGLVIQALRWLGREKVDASVLRRLHARLSKTEREELLMDLRHAPAWIADAMRKLASAA